ncbi:MAG TPA: glycosyltransferase, partial [Phycisphaerae bacterium]|nr:glycosyltransferase [Phycisphaerae bacterium]
SDAFEVVVGLDGHTPAEADALPRDFPYEVTYLPLPPVGISAAKNAAVAAARGDVLLFVNDDIEPEPHFIAAHHTAQQAGHGVVLGASPFVRWRDQNVFDELVARTRMIFFYAELVDGAAYNFRYAWNINLSVSRRLLAPLVGPFTERIQPVFYDDVEFAYRLIGAADAVHYCAAARAPHRHRYDFAGYFAREALLGVMSAELARVNPDCHRAIFRAAPAEVLARAHAGLAPDIPDHQRMLTQFHTAAAASWGDNMPPDYAATLYALHLPLKRRAFRCGLTAASRNPNIPWTRRQHLAATALCADPVFSLCPPWSAETIQDHAPVQPYSTAAPGVNAVPTG